jgi:hypothetical protein
MPNAAPDLDTLLSGPKPPPTREQVALLLAVTETIREAVEGGPGGVPAGHLYAPLVGVCSLEVYQQAVRILIAGKRIERRGELLVAVGR